VEVSIINLKSLIGAQHPNSWMFIETFQKSNSQTIVKFLNIQIGTVLTEKKYEQRQKNMILEITKESEIK